MKQKKQADKSAKKQAKPKLVKKPKEDVYRFPDETIDVYMADFPTGLTRRLYWNMAMSNLKKWLKTFF